MSRGECIACSDCTCHTAVLSSVKGMQQLLVMTACAMFTCLVMAACAMFQCCPKTPKPKKERVERMRECFLRMFSVPKGLCRNFRFAEMWPIDFRVNASELRVQSAMQGTALSLVLRMRSMCFPLKCFLLNVP